MRDTQVALLFLAAWMVLWPAVLMLLGWLR